MKKAALTCRVVTAEGYDEPRDALSHDWLRWAEARRLLPFAIPNVLADPASYLSEIAPDILILTGGNDAVAVAGKKSDYTPIRNESERAFLDWALAAGVPVLAVCRGFHIVNLYFEGSVKAEIGERRDAHVANDHDVEILDDLRGAVAADRIQTNSFHTQGVSTDGLAKDLRPFGQSGDGLIEAAVHRVLPCLAIQWHPERSNPGAALDDMLISRLMADGAFWVG